MPWAFHLSSDGLRLIDIVDERAFRNLKDEALQRKPCQLSG